MTTRYFPSLRIRLGVALYIVLGGIFRFANAKAGWLAGSIEAGVSLLGSVFEMIVIARGAKRAAAIQLDCFVVPQSGAPRNDRIRRHTLVLFSVILVAP